MSKPVNTFLKKKKKKQHRSICSMNVTNQNSVEWWDVYLHFFQAIISTWTAQWVSGVTGLSSSVMFSTRPPGGIVWHSGITWMGTMSGLCEFSQMTGNKCFCGLKLWPYFQSSNVVFIYSCLTGKCMMLEMMRGLWNGWSLKTKETDGGRLACTSDTRSHSG